MSAYGYFDQVCKSRHLSIDAWYLEAWLDRFDNSLPREQLAHACLSRDYSKREAHVFRLENGKYALVVEEGCSCYQASDAQIELFPSKKAALAKFMAWEKEARG